MKGWVGLVGRPTADGLPTLVVTRQLHVDCRTAKFKVRLSETDVLPLCHATNQCSVLALTRAGFSLADVQVMSFCFMFARNRFYWPTASSMTFCDMLAHLSMRRCFKSPVTAAGIAYRCLYNVHTFLHQYTTSVVNRTVWRTQIWR